MVSTPRFELGPLRCLGLSQVRLPIPPGGQNVVPEARFELALLLSQLPVLSRTCLPFHHSGPACSVGARREIRTRRCRKAPEPKSGASTNFARRATLSYADARFERASSGRSAGEMPSAPIRNLVPRAEVESAMALRPPPPQDGVSTNSTTWASSVWTREPESNRRRRFCRPLPGPSGTPR